MEVDEDSDLSATVDFSVVDNCKACETVLSSSVVPSVEVGLKTELTSPIFTPPLPAGRLNSNGRQPTKVPPEKSSNREHHCGATMDTCRCSHTAATSGHSSLAEFPGPQVCLKKLSLMPARKIDHSTNLPLSLSSSEFLSTSYRIPPADRLEFRTAAVVDFVVTQLRRFGWCWVDSFLGPNHADGVLDQVEQLYEEKSFHDGQLAKPAGPFAQLVRTDKIRWYDPKIDSSNGKNPISVLLAMIDHVIMAASPQLASRICGRSKGMISCYPGNGTHYITHVDNPDKDGKLITAIYYVNKEWIAAAGGNLRLYPQNATNYVDVYPIFDRVCFFWSDRRNPHEVLPVFQKRFAITVWYFDAQEKAAAVRRELHKQNCEMRKRMIVPQCGAHGGQSPIIDEAQYDVQPIKPLSMVTFKDICGRKMSRQEKGNSCLPQANEIDITDVGSSQTPTEPLPPRPSVIQMRTNAVAVRRTPTPDNRFIQVD